MDPRSTVNVPEDLRRSTRAILSRTFPDEPDLTIRYLCKPKAVADDATKLIVLDRANTPLGVILISSPVEPQLIRRGIDRASEIKEHLGPELGGVILEPLASGDIEGNSFAILPYHRPVSNRPLMSRVHRFMLRPIVLEWLASVTEATAHSPDIESLHDAFTGPLEELASNKLMELFVRSAADDTLGRIASGAWRPTHTVMHGDFWLGNVLFHNKSAREQPGRTPPIVIIDWPGGLINGYGMYDLVRLGMSMKIPPPVLRVQVGRHCHALGCEPRDARSHLLSGLAHLGRNLGHFPPERYARMTADCLRSLNQSVPV